MSAFITVARGLAIPARSHCSTLANASRESRAALNRSWAKRQRSFYWPRSRD